MSKLHQYPPEFDAWRDMVIKEDFDHIVTADRWTVVATDSGTATIDDAPAGILTLAPSDGTVADNDEIYVHTTAELFDVLDDQGCYCECYLKWTEANTDDANVAFGFMNAVGANSILDDGGGPKADYSGAVIFKVDGGTVWQCESSVGTSQTTTASVSTAGGATYQKLGIAMRPITTTLAEVTFSIDGQPFLDSDDRPIKHNLTYTSLTEMNLFVGAKNGDTNNESIKVDYILGIQRRADA